MTLTQYKKKRSLKKSGEPKAIAKKSSGKNVRFSSEAIEEIASPQRKGKSLRPTRSKKTARLFSFVIQKHNASHLHWDLRLQMNGVLKSWAVPKQPPRKKGVKRLAIHVEDHPLEYAKFKGIIPEGNYGAGKVEIWDKGTYELVEKDSKTPKGVPRNIFKKMFTKGKIEFKLHGKKLKGNYVLIKTNYGNKPEKSWLFFKI